MGCPMDTVGNDESENERKCKTIAAADAQAGMRSARRRGRSRKTAADRDRSAAASRKDEGGAHQQGSEWQSATHMRAQGSNAQSSNGGLPGGMIACALSVIAIIE